MKKEPESPVISLLSLIMSMCTKSMQKIASLYGLVHIYIARVAFSAFSGHALFCIFPLNFCNSYIQINAAEYRRL